jgi:teichoic acid transport system ATP-binding protein
MSFDIEDCAIIARNLGKCYHIFRDPKERLKQAFWRGRRRFSRDFWALRNISLQIKKSQSVGIIGQNGSGKSTLLQILAGAMIPTTGEARIQGSVASLLELGTGFNMDFTGRENAFFNGAIVGISREEMEHRIEEIIQFAEIGEFIDQPVKTYSSGMYVRLAFACAVHVDPDILLIDEALAVGDTYFQLKCMEKLNQFQKAGKTILLVTHSSYNIKSLCDTGIWLDGGEIITMGDSLYVADLYNDFTRCRSRNREVTAKSYLADLRKVEQQRLSSICTGRLSEPSAGTDALVPGRDFVARVLSYRLLNGEGYETYRLKTHETMVLDLTYEVCHPMEGLVLGVAILKVDGYYVCGLNTALDQFQLPEEAGIHRVQLRYPSLMLLGGVYRITLGLFDRNAIINIDLHRECLFFEVVMSRNLADGAMVLPHEWHTKERVQTGELERA